jgi:hypothetical protein
MAKRAATLLSKDRRLVQIRKAQQSLGAFLQALPPLVRRSIVEPESLTIGELIEAGTIVGTPEAQKTRTAALTDYQRLAIQVPTEWRRYRRRNDPAYVRLIELILLGHVKRRGAQKKHNYAREPVLIAERVGHAMERLRMGAQRRRRCKRRGGSGSDDVEIRPRLRPPRCDRTS